MKTEIFRACIFIFKGILNFIYLFLKIIPVKKGRILFCSRQSNEIPLDFRLIEEELKERRQDIKCTFICRKIEGGIKGYIAFAACTLRSMYHLAASEVCIIDSYWPAVSLLKHKRSLDVIQLWHAIGKIKKSGHASLGAKSGRSSSLAKALNMHRNYDHIIAGAEAWNDFYCQSFDVSEDKLLNYGLPRIDYLINTEEQNRKRFFDENPELSGRKIILYAPTFRRNMESKWAQIADGIDCSEYVLIIKNHPSQRIYDEKPQGHVYYFDDWKTMDLISVCDYVITDYSAIALEAAVLNKKTYYWLYDYEEYTRNNGLNIDLYDVVPDNVFENVEDIMRSIESNSYSMEQLKKYRERFLPQDLGSSARKICDLIISCL